MVGSSSNRESTLNLTRERISVIPVLLSRFMLDLRRCSEERRSAADDMSQVSTAMSWNVTRPSIIAAFGSDLLDSNRSLVDEA